MLRTTVVSLTILGLLSGGCTDSSPEEKSTSIDARIIDNTNADDSAPEILTGPIGPYQYLLDQEYDGDCDDVQQLDGFCTDLCIEKFPQCYSGAHIPNHIDACEDGKGPVDCECQCEEEIAVGSSSQGRQQVVTGDNDPPVTPPANTEPPEEDCYDLDLRGKSGPKADGFVRSTPIEQTECDVLWYPIHTEACVEAELDCFGDCTDSADCCIEGCTLQNKSCQCTTDYQDPICYVGKVDLPSGGPDHWHNDDYDDVALWEKAAKQEWEDYDDGNPPQDMINKPYYCSCSIISAWAKGVADCE